MKRHEKLEDSDIEMLVSFVTMTIVYHIFPAFFASVFQLTTDAPSGLPDTV
jgi:hypothetical protein